MNDLQRLQIPYVLRYQTEQEQEQAMRGMIDATTKAETPGELYEQFTRTLPSAPEMEREAEDYLNHRKQSNQPQGPETEECGCA